MSELDEDDLGNGFKIFVKKALPLTIITAIFCVIGLYLLNNNYNFESAILKIIYFRSILWFAILNIFFNFIPDDHFSEVNKSVHIISL